MERTEKVQNCLNPKFAKKFQIDYYFEIVQKLKFGIYDIDNKTVDLSDDDFLGELECTLGQVKSFFPFPPQKVNEFTFDLFDNLLNLSVPPFLNVTFPLSVKDKH